MKLFGLAPCLQTRSNPQSGAFTASGKPPSLGRVWPGSEGMPFWRGPALLGRRRRRGDLFGGPWERAAACPLCGVGSRRSLASAERWRGTAATVNVVCITARRTWFPTTSMARDVSRIPELSVTPSAIAPALLASEQEARHPAGAHHRQTPASHRPPSTVAILSEPPRLPDGSGTRRDVTAQNARTRVAPSAGRRAGEQNARVEGTEQLHSRALTLPPSSFSLPKG